MCSIYLRREPTRYAYNVPHQRDNLLKRKKVCLSRSGLHSPFTECQSVCCAGVCARYSVCVRVRVCVCMCKQDTNLYVIAIIISHTRSTRVCHDSTFMYKFSKPTPVREYFKMLCKMVNIIATQFAFNICRKYG